MLPGRSIEYQRVEDYWAKDLPVRRGHYNFDRVRFEFHADRASGLLAFKARQYEFREEFTSRAWATEYDFAEMKSGAVKREELPDGTISGGQGWYLNLRRPKFADIRIREALQLCFDFEWSNAKSLLRLLYAQPFAVSGSAVHGQRHAGTGGTRADGAAALEHRGGRFR